MMRTGLTKRINIFFVLCYVMLTVFGLQSEAFAAHHKKKAYKITHKPGQASLVVDARTGAVLHQVNASKQLHPASLTKLMTIYLAFEAINHGKLQFNSKLRVSKFAASRPRTNLGLRAGDRITAKEAILSLIVKSANDAAVVLGEAIGGSEKNFARIMTNRARQLGMRNTNFVNASGWHHPEQKTTAYDLAKLAIALKRDFPKYYSLFSRTSFHYRSHFYRGHNHVVEKLSGAEGMKTGYTGPSGWNLVTTAKRGNIRLVGVVLGGSNAKMRDTKMINLMNHHFKRIQLAQNTERTVYAMNKLEPATQDKNIIRVSDNGSNNSGGQINPRA